MSVLPHENFCVLPWLQRLVSERGRLFPCAFSMESGAPLQHEDGRPFGPEDWDAAWNGAEMRSLRRKFLAGVTPPTCARCFRLESFGLPSLREVANRHWAETARPLLASAQADGSALPVATALDLRFGNLCNLRCRMCSPESSAKMAEEFRTLHPGLPTEYYAEVSAIDWFRNPATRSALLSRASELRELHFAGGEPFLIPEVRIFLEELVASGEAGHVTLTFNTNLTLLPEPLYRLWPSFEKVKLIVSLDGVGAVNDYIRFPSRFTGIEANLRFLDENRERMGCALVCFNTTVQAYNLPGLVNLIRYVTTEFRNFFPFPILSPLSWPAPLAPGVVPAPLREKVAAELESLAAKELSRWRELEGRCDYPSGAERFQRAVVGLARMLREESAPAAAADFLHYTSVLDDSRQQQLAHAVPELAAAFGFEP